MLGSLALFDSLACQLGRQTATCIYAVSENAQLSTLVVFVVLALGTHTSSAQGTFRRADIDSTGQLRVVLVDNRIIRPPKDSDQVTFEQVALSADRRIVGWVALYPNCCTSYAIPLKLVLLRTDGSRTVISNEMPIWQWAFAADGRNVVIRQASVHVAAPMYYELRAIRTGRLIARAQTDSTPHCAAHVSSRRDAAVGISAAAI